MSVAVDDIAEGMHRACCPAEEVHDPVARWSCRALWQGAARTFAGAPSYERAVEVFHENTCEVDHHDPRHLSQAEHVAWLGSRYELRRWWVRAGHCDPCPQVIS